MADKKISQLTAVSTPLAGTEVLPIVQSGVTKKVTALELTGVTVTTDERVGVGGVPDTTVNGSSITAKFGVHQDGGSTNYPVVEAVKYSDVTATAGVTIYGARGRGSKAAPTVVSNGDLLSAHIAAGYDGTDFALSSCINYEVDGTPGNDDMPGRIVFLTAADGSQIPTERMRLDSRGNLLVGTNSPLGVGVVLSPSATEPLVGVTGTSTTGGSTYTLYSTGASAYRFYVTFGGVINATNTTITGISDQRLKENIRDLDDGLDAVMALKPRKFDWKAGKGKDIANDRGFIAQEFEQVFPDMIHEWKDPAPDGEEPYKAVNANLFPTLVKAIQEQQTQINQLRAEIAALKGN